MENTITPISEEEIAKMETTLRNRCYLKEDDYHRIPVPTIKKWAVSENIFLREAAIHACWYQKELLLDVIASGICERDLFIRRASLHACERRDDIPLDTIEKWLKDENYKVRVAAMYACRGRAHKSSLHKEILWEVLDSGLNDRVKTVRDEAEISVREALIDYVFASPDDHELPPLVPNLDIIKKWMKSDNSGLKEIIVGLCRHNSNFPPEIIEMGLNDENIEVLDKALSACRERDDIPIKVIERWSTAPNANVRLGSVIWGREFIPQSLIKRFDYPDNKVLEAARKFEQQYASRYS